MSLANRTLFCLVLLGGFLLFAAKAQPKLEVEGSDADKKALDALQKKCEGESKAFRELKARVKSSKKTVKLKVGRNQPGVVVDRFEGDGAGTVDLSDLEKFPNPKKRPAGYELPGGQQYEFPAGVPSWAGTVCENFAHILAEYLHAAENAGTDKGKWGPSHEEGIKGEESVRADFGQKEKKGDTPFEKHGDHNDGVTEYDGKKERVHLDANDNITSITYGK